MPDVTIDGNLLILDPPALDSTARAIAAEMSKQTALLSALADTTPRAAMLADWRHVRDAIAQGLGEYVLPVGSQFVVPWRTKASSSAADATYQVAFNPAHHGTGALADGEVLPVMLAQMHRCLPFDTQFSPYQAFLKAIDPLPAGTYNVTMGFTWGSNVVNGKKYQFTLANDLPAGGVLAGFYRAPDTSPATWRVYAYASQTSASATETCVVTEGSGGTSLGTFTAAGVAVPASGTPESASSVTVDGKSVSFYGLNSLHRVAFGNNRWLHSPLRQYLNASGFGWWAPQTVFDMPPAYEAREGFLSGFSGEFVEAMRPIAMKTALNHVTDGGTSASPLYDTTYDRVFLPSGRQHFIADTASYGGGQGQEGDPWEYWSRVLGSTTPATWGQTYPEYCQYDLGAQTTPRTCWMRSAHRGGGHHAACVTSSGHCSGGGAYAGLRAAAACAIG